MPRELPGPEPARSEPSPGPGPTPGPGPAAPVRAAVWPGVPVLASAFAELRAALRHGGLAVRRLVLVYDALAGGLVQALRRSAHRHGRRLHVAGVSGLAELAHRGLQRRPDSLVALPRLLVLLIALDLGLDIRHAEASLRFWFSSVGAGGFGTRGSPTNSRRGATLRRGRISQPPGRAQTRQRGPGAADRWVSGRRGRRRWHGRPPPGRNPGSHLPPSPARRPPRRRRVPGRSHPASSRAVAAAPCRCARAGRPVLRRARRRVWHATRPRPARSAGPPARGR